MSILLVGAIIDKIIFGFEGEHNTSFLLVMKIYAIVWLCFTFVIAFGTIIQSRQFKVFVKNKSITEQIAIFEGLNKNKWKLAFVNIEWSTSLSLGNLYLLTNRIDEARPLLDKGRKSPLSYYPLFLIAIYDNKENEAKLLYQKMLKSRNKNLNIRKETAKRILTMLANQEFDEEIYQSTNYPILKEICLRYKK